MFIEKNDTEEMNAIILNTQVTEAIRETKSYMPVVKSSYRLVIRALFAYNFEYNEADNSYTVTHLVPKGLTFPSFVIKDGIVTARCMGIEQVISDVEFDTYFTNAVVRLHQSNTALKDKTNPVHMEAHPTIVGALVKYGIRSHTDENGITTYKLLASRKFPSSIIKDLIKHTPDLKGEIFSSWTSVWSDEKQTHVPVDIHYYIVDALCNATRLTQVDTPDGQRWEEKKGFVGLEEIYEPTVSDALRKGFTE